MKKILSIIVLLSICLACTSCKENENDVVGSLETENSITETISETTTAVATETTTQTSVITTSETTVETTIEIPTTFLLLKLNIKPPKFQQLILPHLHSF